jgi:hypothetical protein
MTQKKLTADPAPSTETMIDPIRAESGKLAPPAEAKVDRLLVDSTKPTSASERKAAPALMEAVAPGAPVSEDPDQRRVDRANSRLDEARKALREAEAAQKDAVKKLESKQAKEAIDTYKKFSKLLPDDGGFDPTTILEIVGHAIAKRIGPARLIAIIDREPAGE